MSTPPPATGFDAYQPVHRDLARAETAHYGPLRAVPDAGRATDGMSADVQSAFVRALVSASDTLTGERDTESVIDHLVEVSKQLVEGAEVSVSLAQDTGKLRLVACSTESLRVIEQYQVEHLCGPNIDSYKSGEPIAGEWPERGQQLWPNVAKLARVVGYRFYRTIPLRLRNETIGVLSIAEAGDVSRTPVQEPLLRALADSTTIGLVNRRIYAASVALSHQLQTALTTRVLIEQSKGAVAARLGLTVDEAFVLLRTYARDSNQRLNQVSRSVLDGTLATHELWPSEKRRLLAQ